ncbi:MAG: RloB domain-containing protein [Phycisphaerae bacterium]|nr:RloB domain-containing protein [Phycisphaerae bacterium]
MIDKDRHETLDSAIQKAKDNDISLILSNPCFEYWFLLHFKKHAGLFQHHREVAAAIKRHFPQYKKNEIHGRFFETIYEKTDIAIQNAKTVIREKHWGDDLRECNPSTHVHFLVEHLRSMTQKPY